VRRVIITTKNPAASAPKDGCLDVSQGIFLVKTISFFNRIFCIYQHSHPDCASSCILKVKAQPEFQIVIAQNIFSGDNPYQLFLIIDHRNAAQPHGLKQPDQLFNI
jgi:hypothetical protein